MRLKLYTSTQRSELQSGWVGLFFRAKKTTPRKHYRMACTMLELHNEQQCTVVSRGMVIPHSLTARIRFVGERRVHDVRGACMQSARGYVECWSPLFTKATKASPQVQPPAERTVTVMKADSTAHFYPSTACVTDGNGCFDHPIRASIDVRWRRTAPELCVIRRSIQTLRASCRLVPHNSVIADALTPRATETA